MTSHGQRPTLRQHEPRSDSFSHDTRRCRHPAYPNQGGVLSMHLGIKALQQFLAAQPAQAPLVLATVIATDGSTYRKPGAMMLIGAAERYAGMISGGCLEGDLVAQARAVFADGQSRQVSYDLQNDEDLVWGLGLGCGGAVHLLLQRLDAENDYAPLGPLFRALDAGHTATLALQIEGQLPAGSWALETDDGHRQGEPERAAALGAHSSDRETPRARRVTLRLGASSAEAVLMRVTPTPRILVCGGGPDAVPLVAQIVALGWDCTVVDHRPAFAQPERFPAEARVQCLRPGKLTEGITLKTLSGAIVMSHHLEHDATYLRQLAQTPPPYLALLGPRARRDQLLATIDAPDLKLHGPAGLDLGAELPEAIALAIAAQLHAQLNGREGGPLSRG